MNELSEDEPKKLGKNCTGILTKKEWELCSKFKK
jgi:hypothetical protein